MAAPQPAATRELLERTAHFAASYRESLPERAVRSLYSPQELQQALRVPLTDSGEPAGQVIEALAKLGALGTTASAGPRYFGFVVGGSTPAALAADWLVSAWDQNGGLHALSPLIAAVEEVTAEWLLEVLQLPVSMSVGFVTGCQMASFTALAAARHRVLRKAGWDVEAEGLSGAPPIEILASEESHYTIHVALRYLGLGVNHVRRVPTDAHGRMEVDALAARLEQLSGPGIVCAQAGNVNGGSFDSLREIAALTHARGAWLHVDGAFGLWAAATPGTRSWCAASSRPTRSRPTPTSGSTSHTTAGSFSVRMRQRTVAPWGWRCLRSQRPTSRPACASATRTSSFPKHPAGAVRSRYTPRCGRSDARGSRSSSSATAARHSALPRDWRPPDTRC